MSKDLNISYLRILATVGVIWLHLCAAMADYSELYGLTSSQLVFFSINHHCIPWAVPCFFMITGLLLLNPEKNITTDDCIWKYARRIFLAILIFGIPMAIAQVLFVDRTIAVTSLISETLRKLIENDNWAHLWYLYCLLGIYLILPIIRSFVKEATEKSIIFILTVCFIFSFILPFIEKITDLDIAFKIPLTYPIFYLFLGYYIKNFRRPSVNISIVGVILCLILIALVCIFQVENISLGKNSPIIAIFSCFIFSLFMRERERERENCWATRIWQIDRLCFGVYLVHPIFIQVSYRVLHITPISFENYILMSILLMIIFTILSFTLSFILSKIPPLKKWVL